MTISEAIASEIQPYSVAEEAIEKMFIDAVYKYDLEASVDEDYSVAYKKPVAYAAMRLLYKMRPLSSENIGGVSQGYKNEQSLIDDMIKSVAKDAGIDPALVLNEESDNYWLTAKNVW